MKFAIHSYYVYILTNINRTVLYIGVTNNLERRLSEHKENTHSFSSRYKTYFLIYYEEFQNISEAINREKQMKKWSRIKKEKTIADFNPKWEFFNNDPDM